MINKISIKTRSIIVGILILVAYGVKSFLQVG